MNLRLNIFLFFAKVFILFGASSLDDAQPNNPLLAFYHNEANTPSIKYMNMYRINIIENVKSFKAYKD